MPIVLKTTVTTSISFVVFAQLQGHYILPKSEQF